MGERIVLAWYDDQDVDDLTTLLNPVHEMVLAAGGGDMLRLCVGIVGNAVRPVAQTPKEIEEEYSKRVLWCLNRGYEFISACDL